MHFLDLDLDFFLNKNSYRTICNSGRQGSEYKPWSAPKLGHFLESRCGLSSDSPTPGRSVEIHDEVLNFWRMLIEYGWLKIPFEVVHVDAHPDLWVGDWLSLTSEFLRVDSKRCLVNLREKQINSGNYLTFAIAYGWISSLIWIPLTAPFKDLPEWDADARSILLQRKKRKLEGYPTQGLPKKAREYIIPFKIIPWQRFRTSETFDYITLSRSPNFTPPESDRLIAVIEEYMTQI